MRRRIGKHFHTGELSFRCRNRVGPCDRSRGRENFKATRLYPSPCCIRKTLARRVFATLGRAAIAANGALGISSETCVDRGIGRRTASSIPPAETLRAVANSKSSLFVSPRLLTKTGIAKGNRDQRLRSADEVLMVTHTPSFVIQHDTGKHPTGQNLS